MGQFLYTLIIYPLTLCIECIYTLFNRFTDNAGFCVIGVSIGVTLLCLPLYAVAEHWQEIERKKQASMKPVLNHIKQVFSGDERYMMTSAYYRQNNYSPLLGLRSSFGLLIQVPFFIAAYTFLSHLSALKGESFLFISDMGSQDALFKIGAFPINILPIAMTLINIISGLVYTKGFSVREKLTPMMLALVFLVILYPSPSGLVLYWTFNNIFSLVKNIFYKFKNPLKVFWVFCCISIIPFTVFLLFFTTTKWKYKIVFLFIVGIIYTLPLIVRKASRLLDTFLNTLYENGNLRKSLYFFSCISLFLLTGFVIPCSLISSSAVEFASIGEINPIQYILTTALQSLGIFGFWALCIYFLFNKKVQTFLALFAGISAVFFTLNTFIFNLPYGDISTSLVFLNASIDFKTISPSSLINFFSFFVIAFLFVLGLHKNFGKFFTSILLILSLTFISITTVNIHSIQSSYSSYLAGGKKSSIKEIEPIFHLSKNAQNVVVFMLDRAEGEYVQEIMKEAPELKDIYSGFVHYNNCLSFNSHTFQGSPGLYGGYEYTPLEMNKRDSVALKEKHNQSLLLLPRIFTEQADFDAVVTDPSWANYSDYMDLSIFEPYPKIKGYQTYGTYSQVWFEKNGELASELNTAKDSLHRNLLFFSFFRTAPVVLRELIYKKGTYWSTSDINDLASIIDWYAPLDFLPELTEITDSKTGSYVCMVNELTHENAFLQAPEYVPVKKATDYGTSKYRDSKEYHTSMAAFKRIAKWIQYLKTAGVYDNTKIIMVSDHGTSGSDAQMEPNEELDKALFGGDHYGRGRFHCLLMVKDFGAKGELLQDQTTFMTNADVPSIALNGVLPEPVNPFTEKTIPLNTENLKKDGVFISASDKHVPVKHGKYKFSIEKENWWRIKDSIFKSENWKNMNPFSE